MFTWPFIPQRIHTETLEWKTDVIRTKAAEERIALRIAPRHTYDYDYVMDERQFSRAKLLSQDGEDVYLPIWSELTHIDSVSAGAVALTFDTEYAHYIVDGQAIIWSADDVFEIVTIDTLTVTGITWTGGLTDTHSPAIVMPIKTCKFTQALRAQRIAPLYSKTSVGFVTTETEIVGAESTQEIPPMFDVLLDCNVLISGAITESYLQEMDVLDYDTGDIWSDEAFRYPMRHSVMNWHNKDKAESWAVREWLHERRGQWKLFWLPSWNNDFEVVATIDADDQFITINDIGYADHVDIIRYAMITTNAGARHFFRILDANNTLSPGHETLYVGEVFGTTLTVSEIAQGSLLTLMRLSADRVEIKHNDAGQSFISVPLMDPIFNGGFLATIAGNIPTVTGVASGWISLHATIAGTLPAITGAATATVRQYIGNAAGTLPAIDGAATGWTSLHATASGTLPAVTGSATATYTSP